MWDGNVVFPSLLSQRIGSAEKVRVLQRKDHGHLQLKVQDHAGSKLRDEDKMEDLLEAGATGIGFTNWFCEIGCSM